MSMSPQIDDNGSKYCPTQGQLCTAIAVGTRAVNLTMPHMVVLTTFSRRFSDRRAAVEAAISSLMGSIHDVDSPFGEPDQRRLNRRCTIYLSISDVMTALCGFRRRPRHGVQANGRALTPAVATMSSAIRPARTCDYDILARHALSDELRERRVLAHLASNFFSRHFASSSTYPA